MAGKTEGLCNGRVGAGVRTCTVGLGAEGRSQVVEIGERTLLIFVESNDLERGVTWCQRLPAPMTVNGGVEGGSARGGVCTHWLLNLGGGALL